MSVLAPFETAVSWLLINIHLVLSRLAGNGRVAWWLAIVVLVLIIRTLLVPLAIRQWHAQAQLARLRPAIEDLRRKHKNSRAAHQEALAALFQDHRVSPFGSLLPLVVQLPVVFALYRVLNAISHHHPIGVFASHPGLAASASAATVLGVHLSSTLRTPATGVWWGRLVVAAVILVTAAVTYLMQRSTPNAAVGETAHAMQVAMTYLPTVSVVIFGCFVPLGVLVYWLTNTAFLAGQQWLLQRRLSAAT